MLEVEAEEGGIEWEDPRIQSWSGREENVHWLKRALATETELGFIHVSLTYAELERESDRNSGNRQQSGEDRIRRRIDGQDHSDRLESETCDEDVGEVDLGGPGGSFEG